jgi:PAB-dependent poly(A)-specific ribonuclease subunit 3
MGTGGIPAELDNYHSLYPLEPVGADGTPPTPGKVFGFQSVMYKGVSDQDGLPYVLRRLDGVRVTEGKAMSRVDAWKAVSLEPKET